MADVWADEATKNAFSDRALERIQDAFKTSARGFTEKMFLALSGDEFISAFIRPEHVDVLKQTEAIVGLIGNTSGTVKLFVNSDLVDPAAESMNVWFSARGKCPILLPKYIIDGMHEHAPSDVRAKVQNWADERYKLGCELADAYDALQWLNDRVANKWAFASLFPAVSTLLTWVSDREDSAERKLAAKITARSNITGIPAMPRETKARLRELSSLVQSISLTTNSVAPEVPKGYVSFSGVSVNRVGPSLFNSHPNFF